MLKSTNNPTNANKQLTADICNRLTMKLKHHPLSISRPLARSFVRANKSVKIISDPTVTCHILQIHNPHPHPQSSPSPQIAEFISLAANRVIYVSSCVSCWPTHTFGPSWLWITARVWPTLCRLLELSSNLPAAKCRPYLLLMIRDSLKFLTLQLNWPKRVSKWERKTVRKRRRYCCGLSVWQSMITECKSVIWIAQWLFS